MFEYLYLIGIVIYLVLLTPLKDYKNYIKKVIIVFVIISIYMEVFYLLLLLFLHKFTIRIIMPGEFPTLYVTNIFTVSFSLIALVFGIFGIVLLEDKNMKERLNPKRGWVIIGVLMVFLFLMYLFFYIWNFIIGHIFWGQPIIELNPISFDPGNIHIMQFFSMETLDLTIFRLSFFLFFISGFYAGRRMKPEKSFWSIFIFCITALSVILAILDSIFKIVIRWDFLYTSGFYFGFFFLFQSSSFLYNLKSNYSEIKGRSLSIIMIFSFVMLIFALFVFENIESMMSYALGFADLWFLLFLLGFIISLRYSVSKYLFIVILPFIIFLFVLNIDFNGIIEYWYYLMS